MCLSCRSVSTALSSKSDLLSAPPDHGLAPPAWRPPSPRTLDQVDISESRLIDLAVRHISLRGVASIHLLASLMKLPLELAEAVFRRLSDQQYIEVKRMSGDDYVFSLSPAGRKLAAERALSSRYAGPGARIAESLVRGRSRPGVAGADHPREAAARLRGHCGERPFAGCARPGPHFARRDVSLRPQRHRKDNHFRAAHARVR